MGLRTLDIPANPQPKDIGNPIPSQADSFESALQGYRPPRPAAGAAPAPSGSAGPLAQDIIQAPEGYGPPQIVNQDAGQQVKGVSSADDQKDADLMRQLASASPKDQKLSAARALEEEAASLFGGGSAPAAAPGGEGAGVKAHMLMGLGQNDTERLNALKKLFGEKGARQNKDGKFQFRRAGEKSWQSVDADSGLNAFLGDVGNLVAPGAQMALEGAVMGGMAAATPLTSGASAVAGAIAAPAAGQIARRAAVNAAGIEDPNFTAAESAKQIGEGAIMNAAALGLGEVGAKIYSSFKTPAMSPNLSEVQKMAIARKSLDDIAKDARLVPVAYGPGGGEIGPKAVGEALSSAADTYHQRLGEAVSLVNDKAIQMAGDQKFTASNALNKMKEIIVREGGTINPETGLFLALEKPGTTQTAIRDVSRGTIEPDQALAVAAAPSRQRTAFGSESGPSLLSDMINDYNAFAAEETVEQGSSMRQLLDRTHKYQNSASYGNYMKNNKMNTAIQDVAEAAAKDREAAFDIALQGTEERKFASDAYQSFQNNIDRVKGLKQSILDRESGELIASAVFQPKNAERVRKVKEFLGEDSDEWKMLRGRFIQDKIDSAIDPRTEIFDSKKFINSLSKQELGSDMLREIGDPETINRLRSVARYADSIRTDEITTTTIPKVEQLVKGISQVFKGNAQGAVKTFMQISKANSAPVNYLLDGGYVKLAKQATTKEAEQEILDQLRIMRKVVDNSFIANTGGAQRYIMKQPKALMAGAAAVNSAARQAMTPRNAGQTIESELTKDAANAFMQDQMGVPEGGL